MRRSKQLSLTKSQVNKAGRNIRGALYSDADVSAIEEWRAAHTYVLNTFQANLRRRAKDKNIIVAERLKRRSTIFDKLIREPTMALSNMHDIAGCRLIFSNETELQSFINNFSKARFEHIRIDRDRYNYILNPKEDGYRGIHQVYQFNGAGIFASRWNGLCIEIQFRTVYHHAWATAVEIAGILNEGNHKFGKAPKDVADFFRVTSELIARAYEDRLSCLAHLTLNELLLKFHELDKKTGMLSKLKGLQFVVNKKSDAKNIILILHPDNKLTIWGFKDDDAALREYFSLERTSAKGTDIVLVRAGEYKLIKNAYRNYFGDAKDFVKYVTVAVDKIKKKISKKPQYADQFMLKL